MSGNAIHNHERDEHRTERRRMTEADRANSYAQGVDRPTAEWDWREAAAMGYGDDEHE